MPKIKYLSLSLLFFVFLLAGLTQRHAIACELIEYSDYEKISPNVYASPSFSLAKKEHLLSLIESAKSRVSSTFGPMVSNPKVVVVADESEASAFGSNPYGRALLTPLGQCIIFGAKGHNVDVVAHEHVHAEIHKRVGWFNYLLDVPLWFNEGIALLVDFREPYLIENIDLRREELNTIRNGSFDFSVPSYQAARVLVDSVKKLQLYANLAKLKDGQSFESVFAL